MSREEIIKTTNEFLIEEFEVSESRLKPKNNLQESLDLDSLDYVDLVVIIESNFGVKLESKDFASMVTVQDLYDTIYNKLQK